MIKNKRKKLEDRISPLLSDRGSATRRAQLPVNSTSCGRFGGREPQQPGADFVLK
jgi:hypothetical protein